jgi:hypothetical protein
MGLGSAIVIGLADARSAQFSRYLSLSPSYPFWAQKRPFNPAS